MLWPERSQERYGMSDGMKRKGNSRLITREVFEPVVTDPAVSQSVSAEPQNMKS